MAISGLEHHVVGVRRSVFGAFHRVVVNLVGGVVEVAALRDHGHLHLAAFAIGVFHRVVDLADGSVAVLAHLHVHLHWLAVDVDRGLLHPGLARGSIADAVGNHEYPEQCRAGGGREFQGRRTLLRLLHGNALNLSYQVSRGMDLAHHGFVLA